MQAEQLNNTFSTLADATRRAMLVHLSTGEANVNALAEPFDMSLPAVTSAKSITTRGFKLA